MTTWHLDLEREGQEPTWHGGPLGTSKEGPTVVLTDPSKVLDIPIGNEAEAPTHMTYRSFK